MKKFTVTLTAGLIFFFFCIPLPAGQAGLPAFSAQIAQNPQAKPPQPAKKIEKKIETSPIKLSGYYKNLLLFSRTQPPSEDFFLDIQRIRLELMRRFTDALTAHLAYDHEVMINDFSRTPDFDLIRQKNQKRLASWDGDKVISDRRHLYWKHSLYRAYLKYNTSAFQGIFGKQAIDWSRMKFYHPFDLFNPISPLDIEQDEKIGADLINLEFFPESFASINFIFGPGENREKESWGLKLSKKLKDYDTSLILAEYKKNKVVGFSFDGYLKDAGLRGEFTYTRKDNKKEFPRLALGLDYNLSPKFYTVVEYFYNGGAEKDASQFISSYDFSRQALTMRKHILGLGLEYELSGILKLHTYTFYDFEGKGVFLNPELRYNMFTDLDLTLGAQVFWGNERSEFGNYENACYAQIKYFF